MIYANDIHWLRSAFEDYNIPIPDPIVEAEELEVAADALVSKLNAAPPPDLTTVTTKTLTKVHKEMVDWPSVAAQIDAAQQIATFAHSEVLEAWRNGSHVLLFALAGPFNDAAQRFTESGDPELASELERLAKVRDELVKTGNSKADLGMSNVEEVTRLCVPLSKNAAVNDLRQLGRKRLFSADWFLDARHVPGLVLRWNLPAQQVELWKELPTENSPEMAAAFHAATIARRDLGLAQRAAAGW